MYWTEGTCRTDDGEKQVEGSITHHRLEGGSEIHPNGWLDEYDGYSGTFDGMWTGKGTMAGHVDGSDECTLQVTGGPGRMD